MKPPLAPKNLILLLLAATACATPPDTTTGNAAQEERNRSRARGDAQINSASEDARVVANVTGPPIFKGDAYYVGGDKGTSAGCSPIGRIVSTVNSSWGLGQRPYLLGAMTHLRTQDGKLHLAMASGQYVDAPAIAVRVLMAHTPKLDLTDFDGDLNSDENPLYPLLQSTVLAVDRAMSAVEGVQFEVEGPDGREPLRIVATRENNWRLARGEIEIDPEWQARQVLEEPTPSPKAPSRVTKPKAVRMDAAEFQRRLSKARKSSRLSRLRNGNYFAALACGDYELVAELDRRAMEPLVSYAESLPRSPLADLLMSERGDARAEMTERAASGSLLPQVLSVYLFEFETRYGPSCLGPEPPYKTRIVIETKNRIYDSYGIRLDAGGPLRTEIVYRVPMRFREILDRLALGSPGMNALAWEFIVGNGDGLTPEKMTEATRAMMKSFACDSEEVLAFERGAMEYDAIVRRRHE